MSEALAAGAKIVPCALCGHRFDPQETSICASCPLGKGCSLACCPNCGYSAPDPSRSTVVRLVARAAAALAGRPRVPASPGSTLAQAAPGSQATIETLEHVPVRQREQLLAYGVAPGRVVDVLQIRPVTIVRVEHAELAFETTLSRAIGIARSPEAVPR
jgi:Fe2+ transport system protein FeoA